MFQENQSTSDYMSMVLTHECNRRCPFCVDDYCGSKGIISKDSVRAGLDYAAGMGIKDILLVGGEPTLHPCVRDIVEMVNAAGFRSVMTTNYTKPDIVRSLDGLVKCFNISFYGQPELPRQDEWESDLTLHTLIHSEQMACREALDIFIDSHQENGHLKFSTLVPCNAWAVEHQPVGYLDRLPCEWVVLFNELLGQKYLGALIKRYDKIINHNAHQSAKCHVDGRITKEWSRHGVKTKYE